MASQAVLQFAEIHDMESTPVQEENGKKSLPPGSYYLLVVPKKSMDKSLITPLCMREGSESIKHLRGFSFVVQLATGMMTKLKGGAVASDRRDNNAAAPPTRPMNRAHREEPLTTEEIGIIDQSIISLIETNAAASVPTEGSQQSEQQASNSSNFIDSTNMFAIQGDGSSPNISILTDPSFMRVGNDENAMTEDTEDIDNLMAGMVLGNENSQQGTEETREIPRYAPSRALITTMNEVRSEQDPGGLGDVEVFIVNDRQFIIYIMVVPKSVEEGQFDSHVAEHFKEDKKTYGRKSKKSEFTLSDSSDVFNSYMSSVLDPRVASVLKKKFTNALLKPHRIFSLRIAMNWLYQERQLISRLFCQEDLTGDATARLFDPPKLFREGLSFSSRVDVYRVQDPGIFIGKKIGHNAFPWVEKSMYDYMKRNGGDAIAADHLTRASMGYFGTDIASDGSNSLSVYHPLEKLSKCHDRINKRYGNTDLTKMPRTEQMNKIRRLEYALTNTCMRRLFSPGYNAALKWPEKDILDSTNMRGYPIVIDEEFIEEYGEMVSLSLSKELIDYVRLRPGKYRRYEDWIKDTEGSRRNSTGNMSKRRLVKASQLTIHMCYMHQVYLHTFTLLPVVIPIIDCLLPGCFNCYSREKSLHFNILISGKPSAGKTDAVNVMIDLIIDGTLDRGTDSSDLAYVVDGAIGMDISYVPEAMPHLTDAKPTSGPDRIKLERIKAVTSDMTNTRNVCVTDEDTGKRTQKKIVCDWFTCLVVVMNEKSGNHESTPLAARFFNVEVPRSDNDSAAKKVAKRQFSTSQSDSQYVKETARLFTHSIQYVSLHIHAALDANVIAPVDMTLSTLVVLKLMENMHELGLDASKLNEIRNIIRVNLLSREYCIQNSILEYYRIYKDDYSIYEFEDLKNIEPLLYSRVEQVCLAFGLLISQYTEPVVSSLYERVCNYFNLSRSVVFESIGKNTEDEDVIAMAQSLEKDLDACVIHHYSVALSVLKSTFSGLFLKVTGVSNKDRVSAQEQREKTIYKKSKSDRDDSIRSKYIELLESYSDDLVEGVISDPMPVDEPRAESQSPPTTRETTRRHTPMSEEEEAKLSASVDDRLKYINDNSIYFSGYTSQYCRSTLKSQMEKHVRHMQSAMTAIQSVMEDMVEKSNKRQNSQLRPIAMIHPSRLTNHYEKRNKNIELSDEEVFEISDDMSTPRSENGTGHDIFEDVQADQNEAMENQVDEQNEEFTEQETSQDPADNIYQLLKTVCESRIRTVRGSAYPAQSHAHFLDDEILSMIVVYAYFYLDRVLCQVYSAPDTRRLAIRYIDPGHSNNQANNQANNQNMRRQNPGQGLASNRPGTFNQSRYMQDMERHREGNDNQDNSMNRESFDDRYNYDLNRISAVIDSDNMLKTIESGGEGKASAHESKKSLTTLLTKEFHPLFSYKLVSGSAYPDVVKLYNQNRIGSDLTLVERVEKLSEIVDLVVMPHTDRPTYMSEYRPGAKSSVQFLDVRSLLSDCPIDIQRLFEDNLTYAGLRPKIFACVDGGSKFITGQSPSKTLILLPNENRAAFTVGNPIHSKDNSPELEAIVNYGSRRVATNYNKNINEPASRKIREKKKQEKKKRKKESDKEESDKESDEFSLENDGYEGVTVGQYASGMMSSSMINHRQEDNSPYKFLSDKKVEKVRITMDLDEWSRGLRVKRLSEIYKIKKETDEGDDSQDAIEYGCGTFGAHSHKYI